MTRYLMLLSTAEKLCGVEAFTRQLARRLGTRAQPHVLDTDPRGLMRVLRTCDAVVFNFPIVAWKLRLIEPLMVALAAKIRRKKTTVILHEWANLDWKRRLALWPVVRMADSLLFSAPEVEAEWALAQAAKRERRPSGVIPIPPNLVPAAERGLAGPAAEAIHRLRRDGRIIIGQFGSIYPKKNSAQVLDVARHLLERGRDVAVVFIGSFIKAQDHVEEDFWRHVEEQGLQDRVLVSGYIAMDEEVVAACRAVDVFCYTFEEGLTSRRGSVLAAALAGRTVVANAPRDSLSLRHHDLFQTLIAQGNIVLCPSDASADIFASVIEDAIERAPVPVDAQQFALNATITALTNVGIQICGFGSQESLVRRVAQDNSFYPQMLGHVHILNMVSGAALLILGMVVIPVMFPVSEDLSTTLVTTALILVTNIILLKIVWLATNSYIAHSRFAVANKIELLFAALRMAAAVVSCLVFNISTVAEWALWNFAAHAVAAIVSLMAINRLGRPRFAVVRDEVPLGFMFASQFFFKAGRSNVDILVLSAVAGSEIVGSYSIARRLTEASYMSIEALNRIVYPTYAAAAMRGPPQVFVLAKKMLFVTVAIALASAVFVYAVSPFLPLLFGAEYVSLSWITRSLCWLVIATGVAATAFEAMGACSWQRIRATISNASNIAGAAAVALAAWFGGLIGVLGTTYVVEIIIAVLAWRALFREQRKASVSPPGRSVVAGSGAQGNRAA
eukprot:g3902.t1